MVGYVENGVVAEGRRAGLGVGENVVNEISNGRLEYLLGLTGGVGARREREGLVVAVSN